MPPNYTLCQPVPESQYLAIARLISAQETSTTSPESLTHWIGNQDPAAFCLGAALDSSGNLVGFHCLYPRTAEADRRFNAYLIVATNLRGHGIGRLLYSRLMEDAVRLEAHQVFFPTSASDSHSLGFAIRRGLVEHRRSIEMTLERSNLNDDALDGLLEKLTNQGFVFTDMAALGDSREARQRLYRLNAYTASTTLGSDYLEPWTDFDDFNRSVCESDWYHPDGQFVVIHKSDSEWVAMSAITRFSGADHAYNLFTGVMPAYRGRGLAQAVKGLALRHAFKVLGVSQVRTNHIAANAPMIAIDNKLGYNTTSETITMRKDLA